MRLFLPSKSLNFRPVLFSIPTAPTKGSMDHPGAMVPLVR